MSAPCQSSYKYVTVAIQNCHAKELAGLLLTALARGLTFFKRAGLRKIAECITLSEILILKP